MKFKMKRMSMKQGVLLFLTALIATAIRIILQSFIPATEVSPLPPSIFIKSGIFPLAFTLFAIIIYGLLAIVFFLLQENLKGTGLKKGLTFGVAFSILWFVFLFEPLPYVFDQSLMEFLAYPFVDAAALIILGLLLGKFIGTDTPDAMSLEETEKRHGWIIVIIVMLSFSIPRYFSYSILHEYSAFDTKPLLTMGWTVAGGISIGIVYLILRSGIAVKSKILKALYFGIVVIGIDLFLFNCFVPLVFDQSFWGSFSRAMQDIIPVTVGVYVAEVIIDVSHSHS